MLEKIRKNASNPIFKVVFGLLIVAFAISGIGSIATSTADNYVVSVGKKKITNQEIEYSFAQMKRSLGSDMSGLSDENLQAMGISKERILNNLIQSSLVAEEVKSLGITIGEDSVKDQIKKMPIFKNVNNQFDAQKFRNFLEQMQMSEKKLKSDIQADINNLILASSVTNNAPQSKLLAAQVAKAVKLKRDIELVIIPQSLNINVALPSEEDLSKYYFENSFKYQIPEKRKISTVKLLKPSGEDKEAFEQRAKIEDEIAAGSNLSEIATKFSLKIENSEITQGDVGNIASEAFKLKNKQLNSFEQEDGNTVLIQVDGITTKSVPEINVVKDKVISDWLKDKKSDESIKFAQSILAQLQDNTNFANVAAANKVQYNKITNFDVGESKMGAEFNASVIKSGPNKVFGVVTLEDGSRAIGKVIALKDTPITALDIEKSSQQGAEIFQQEIFEQYMTYLQSKHRVEFNNQAIK